MSAHRKTDVRRCKITSDFSLQGESAPGSYGPCFWAIPKYKKQQKNTDLWEENCHSGTPEKAEEIFIPPPQGGYTLGSSKKAEVVRQAPQVAGQCLQWAPRSVG